MPIYEPEDFNKITDPEEIIKNKKAALEKKKRLEKNPRSLYNGPGEEKRRQEIAELEASFGSGEE